MNNPTPSPPDSGSKLTGSVADIPAPASASCAWKFIVCLCKLWWMPVVTAILGLVTAAIIIYFTPHVFVATGSLWETARIRVEGEAAFAEDRNNFLGTQSQLLRSDMMRALTLNRMQALSTNEIVKNEKGEIRSRWRSRSSPHRTARFTRSKPRSGDPAFTAAYLNALMDQYLEFRKSSRRGVSSETLASIAEQVQRLERDMKTAQAALAEYQRTNNLASLQEQDSTFAASYLVKLKTELADNQLEKMFLDRPSLSEAETAKRQTLQIKIDCLQKFIEEWKAKMAAADDLIAAADGLKQDVTRNQAIYERLSSLVQNLGISIGIDTETLAIFAHATPPMRSYADAKGKLFRSAGFGLVIGLAIIALLGWYRASRYNLVPPTPAR